MSGKCNGDIDGLAFPHQDHVPGLARSDACKGIVQVFGIEILLELKRIEFITRANAAFVTGTIRKNIRCRDGPILIFPDHPVGPTGGRPLENVHLCLKYPDLPPFQQGVDHGKGCHDRRQDQQEV